MTKKSDAPAIRFKGFSDAWEQRKLGELALFNPKDELPQTFEYVDLESVVGTEMLSHRTEVKSSAPSRAQRLAHTGDLFYQTVRPYQKNNYLFEKPDNNYVFSTGYAQMRPYVDGYFLLSLVQSERFVKVVLDNCTGTSYPAINANDLAEIEVAAPSDESEAQRIGTIFRSIDNLITLHQRKCISFTGRAGRLISTVNKKRITSSWEQRKVGNLLIERNQQAPMSDEYPLMAFIANEGVAPKGERYDRSALVTDTVNKLYKKTEKGDFIYSSNNLETGSIGLNKYGKACISPVYSIFEPTGIADSDFLGRRLVRKDFINAMVKWRQGVIYGQWRIHESDFLKIEITVPSVEEQRKIGAYLDQLDNLITLHQRKFEKLTNVKKSMLEKMFPQNGSSYPEIRFKGFTDPWEQRKLSELTSMHARIGWQNLRTSEFLDSGNYMLITGTDFNDGAINFSTCHYVERERYEQDRNIQIHNGSILITKDGTLGKVAYVQGLSMPATLNAGVFNVQIKDANNVDEKYLFQYLKAPFLMDYVDKKATGGTIKHLNQSILVDFPVILPQRSEQTLIGAFFQQLDNLITLHQRKLEKLQNIKKSMLEKMFV